MCAAQRRQCPHGGVSAGPAAETGSKGKGISTLAASCGFHLQMTCTFDSCDTPPGPKRAPWLHIRIGSQSAPPMMARRQVNLVAEPWVVERFRPLQSPAPGTAAAALTG